MIADDYSKARYGIHRWVVALAAAMDDRVPLVVLDREEQLAISAALLIAVERTAPEVDR